MVVVVVSWLVVGGLWHNNLGRLFNAKFIFKQLTGQSSGSDSGNNDTSDNNENIKSFKNHIIIYESKSYRLLW